MFCIQMYKYNCIQPRYMSNKLYWRIKKNGKWTWKPAKVTEVERRIDPDTNSPALLAVIYLEGVE